MTTTLTVESITASLSPRDIFNANEVSSLLLQIYRTLIRMQYLPAYLLHPGPHDLTHLFPLFEELQLTPPIIHLYSILPYVSTKDYDFYQGGYYADFRNKNDVEDGRNTMYADDRREQMRPWMTPLSLLCNHMSVLFYDSKRHRIGIFEQCDNWSRDRGLREEDGARVQLAYAGHLEKVCEGVDSDESDESAEEGESDDSDGERERKRRKKNQKRDDGHPRLGCGSKGPNIYDDMPSRPAGDVLRDILREYETLEEVPWVYEHGSGREWPGGVKELFFKHGWPRPDFDVEAFELDRMRVAAMERVRGDAMEVFKRVDREKRRVEEGNGPDMLLLRRQIATAETPDEEWMARYRLWQKEQQIEHAREALKEAEAKRDRRFPNRSKPADKPEDWILWELRKWRQDIAYEEEAIKYTTEQAEMFAAGLLGNNVPSLEDMKNIIEGKKRHLQLLHKALEACKKDAERLCPGMEELPIENESSKKFSFFHSRAYAVNGSLKQIEDIKGFMATVPTNCVETLELLQAEMEGCHQSIKRRNEWRDRQDVAIREAEKRKEAIAALKKAKQETDG
ncbi:hypothetical protein QBC36DRAFT_325710 [Triangularia setosa]|uniref:Uncharacterized protein n=1 Tax=Triangularia setosa TaxID=2587417 RepID=A0AAN6W9W2_9PEZI|nr:hypothetical protein QBC36DRAFT_325710 [Podospora setosa]